MRTRLTSAMPALIFALLPAVVACSSDDDAAGSPDAGSGADAHVGPDAAGTCDPFAALPTQWRLIDMVATTAITAPATGELLIDATAGGTGAAADNPYIYVDLETGTKVDLTDVAAATSSNWDLAIKRASVRLNGGDSGPGGRTAAIVEAATLAEVTAAPPAGAFAADDWADEACAFLSTPAGEPAGVLGNWYDYNPGTHVVTPWPEVYVIKRADGTTFKLRVITYYGDEANPMRGAMYHVEWATL